MRISWIVQLSQMQILLSIAALLIVQSFFLGIDARAPRSRALRRHPGPNPRLAKRFSASRSTSQERSAAVPSENDATASFTGNGWSATAPRVSAPKENVWQELTNDEAADVIAFLHDQKELNLTRAARASNWDNSIIRVEVLTPNKTDVLPYVESTSQSKPQRWARATIWFGATVDASVMEYQIGPLPISKSSVLTSLDWTSTKGTTFQRNYIVDVDLQTEFMFNVSASVQDIVTDLLNGTASGGDNDTLDIWGVDPLLHPTPDTTIQWVTFWRIPESVFDGETLMPQGLYFEVNTTGRDPSQWSALGWFYRDVYYNSTETFRAAWEAGQLQKSALNFEGEWIGSDYRGPKTKVGENSTMWGSEKAPPVSVLPGGKEGIRYKVDTKNKYVEWMDFSFYIAFRRDTGLRLFDIKYRGERIIYELGMEEALAHYSAHDPVTNGVAYLDSFDGFGPYAFELLAGYDCPTYATFLDTSFHADEISTTHPNSICLFEADQGYLIQRHTTDAYISTTRNIAFTVRSVSTVGNYDYDTDYTFYLDGTIETFVRASGYIESTHYFGNEDYGYHIHSGLSGAMHDHVLTFKADIDILGTANSFANHTIAPVTTTYPWSHGVERNSMRLFRDYVDNEDNSKLYWPDNAHSMFMVVNKNATNEFGEPRGYRIMPSRGGGMYSTIQNSSILLNSMNFATHALYVTKQKDTEPRATSANNNYDTANPIVDFNAFFDGESLDQEDLVVWFNLGMHHVPHTGDLPNTVFTTAQGSMQIMPHNYLLHDPSRDQKQTIRIDYNDSGVQKVRTFGAEFASSSVNLSSTVPDFLAYSGDVNVRKFPYDPQHPYNDTESII